MQGHRGGQDSLATRTHNQDRSTRLLLVPSTDKAHPRRATESSEGNLPFSVAPVMACPPGLLPESHIFLSGRV